VKLQMLRHLVMREAELLEENRDLGRRCSPVKQAHLLGREPLVCCYLRVARRPHEDEDLVFIRDCKDLDRSVDFLPEAVEDEVDVGKWNRERADG
jgi:hypothetical protein